MADNVTLPGTGVDVATDNIGGEHHQRVKLSVGEDGKAVDASRKNPIPIIAVDQATQLDTIIELLERMELHLSLITGANLDIGN